MTRSKILDVHLISKWFGGIQALSGVSMEIFDGEIVALIGPNGAGKTTFFNCLTGMYVPDDGKITLFKEGHPHSLAGKKPNRITQLGMARTFQNIRLFDQLTVIENVMVGFHTQLKSNFLSAIFQSKTHKREEREILNKSFELLERFGLKDQANLLAKNLPYADQRRLEIARALATNPRLLLLDEPAAGMNPQETLELDRMIVQIRDELKIAILLIEHDMKLVMNLSDRVYVMDRGRGIAQGTPQEVRNDPKVIAAYLGEELEEEHA